MTVNYIAPAILCRVFGEKMNGAEKPWGGIINITCCQTSKMVSGASAYVASKGALESLGKCMYKECKMDVTVNNIMVGISETYSYKKTLESMKSSEVNEQQAQDMLLARTHFKRLIQPGEVADMVNFLLSDSAKNITGATLALDGGFSG